MKKVSNKAAEAESQLAHTKGWECKPLSHQSAAGDVRFLIQTLAIGAAFVLLLMLPKEWGLDFMNLAYFIGPLFAFPLIRMVNSLQRGRDCTYIDDDRIVLVRQVGNRFEQAWIIRVDGIEQVVFRGGGFFSLELRAQIRGVDFSYRTRRGGYISEQSVSRVRLSNNRLILHPRLLKKLIDIAKSKSLTWAQKRMIRRADAFIIDALEKTPPGFSIDQEPTTEAPSESEKDKKDPDTPEKLTSSLIYHFCLLAALGLATVAHLRGSFFWDCVLMAIPVVLAGSTRRAWPLHAGLPNESVRRTVTALIVASCWLVALFMLYLPVLWIATAFYTIVIIYSVAALRYSPTVASRIQTGAVVACIVYAVLAYAWLGNWSGPRIERVASIRYRAIWQIGNQPRLSPNGKFLALAIERQTPGQRSEVADLTPPKDSPFRLLLYLGGRVANTFLFEEEKAIFAAPSQHASVVVLPAHRGPAAEICLPLERVAWTQWAPDSQRLALFAYDEARVEDGKTVIAQANSLWLADLWAPSVRLLVEPPQTLLPPDDMWSTSGTQLRPTIGENPEGAAMRQVIDLGARRTTVLPTGPDSDTASTPTWNKLVSPWNRSVRSPDGVFEAMISTRMNTYVRCVAIVRTSDGALYKTFLTPGAPPEQTWLSWSPDGSRVAACTPSRTWIYNVQKDRVTVAKTWRREGLVLQSLWSHDSRSLYYFRHIGFHFLGLELMRIRVPE